MAEIIKGTTPTLTYAFASVDVADIEVAIMTIKRGDAIKVEKDLTSATVDTEAKTISWTLSQSETLSVAGTAEVMLNWLTEDGTPQEVLTAWLNSESHRKNLLNSSFKGACIGVYEENGKSWISLELTKT